MTLPHFIILSGVCACGKSTVGRALVQKLEEYEFIDGDDFHTPENVKKMSDGVGLNDDDRREWLIKLSNFGNQQKPTILACSALKHSYRKVLTGQRTPSECQIFLLTADKHVLEKRLTNRKNHYAKLPLLESQLETLELSSDSESNVTVIDVGGSIDETVEKIISHLKRN